MHYILIKLYVNGTASVFYKNFRENYSKNDYTDSTRLDISLEFNTADQMINFTPIITVCQTSKNEYISHV